MNYDLARSGILAFMCGFVDTIVFVHMGGLFVAHVTGNFVLLGATIVGTTDGGLHAGTTLLQIATFPVFILAAFIATLAHDRRPSRDARVLLWTVAFLVALAAIWSRTGLAADVGASIILICAMATLNAAQRLAPKLGPPKTVMTGNTTQAAVSLARMWRPVAAPEQKAASLRMPSILVLTFLNGCVLGALGADRFGLAAVGLPALMLIAILAIRPGRDATTKEISQAHPVSICDRP